MGSFFEWKEVESIGHSVKMQHFSTFSMNFQLNLMKKQVFFMIGSFFEWKKVESIEHSVKMQPFPTFFYEISANLGARRQAFAARPIAGYQILAQSLRHAHAGTVTAVGNILRFHVRKSIECNAGELFKTGPRRMRPYLLAASDGRNGPFEAVVLASDLMAGPLRIARMLGPIQSNELLGNEHDVRVVRVKHAAAVGRGRQHRFNFDKLAGHLQHGHGAPRFVKAYLRHCNQSILTVGNSNESN